MIDKSSGAYFWYNTKDQSTQWADYSQQTDQSGYALSPVKPQEDAPMSPKLNNIPEVEYTNDSMKQLNTAESMKALEKEKSSLGKNIEYSKSTPALVANKPVLGSKSEPIDEDKNGDAKSSEQESVPDAKSDTVDEGKTDDDAKLSIEVSEEPEDTVKPDSPTEMAVETKVTDTALSDEKYSSKEQE